MLITWSLIALAALLIIGGTVWFFYSHNVLGSLAIACIGIVGLCYAPSIASTFGWIEIEDREVKLLQLLRHLAIYILPIITTLCIIDGLSALSTRWTLVDGIPRRAVAAGPSLPGAPAPAAGTVQSRAAILAFLCAALFLVWTVFDAYWQFGPNPDFATIVAVTQGRTAVRSQLRPEFIVEMDASEMTQAELDWWKTVVKDQAMIDKQNVDATKIHEVRSISEGRKFLEKHIIYFDGKRTTNGVVEDLKHVSIHVQIDQLESLTARWTRTMIDRYKDYSVTSHSSVPATNSTNTPNPRRILGPVPDPIRK